jgi:hypothetical protein
VADPRRLHISTYLGMLRTAGLIEESGGQVRAGDVLFLGAAR